MSKLKQAPRTDRRWNSSYGTYLSGQAAIDGADHTAIEMEQRWGAGRLRLLVDTALREKFDRQDFLYRQAIHHGDLQEVQAQAQRMATAWRALDRAAEVAGASVTPAGIWETVLADGTVAVLYRDPADAKTADPDGRRVVRYSLEEIGTMLSHYSAMVEAKIVWPGAEVVAIRRQSIQDPLEAVPDGVSLDDRLDGVAAFGV